MNGRYIIYRDLYVGQSSSPVSKAISMCLSLSVPERDVYSCASIYVILSVWIYVIASYIRFCELSDEIEESFISTKHSPLHFHSAYSAVGNKRLPFSLDEGKKYWKRPISDGQG